MEDTWTIIILAIINLVMLWMIHENNMVLDRFVKLHMELLGLMLKGTVEKAPKGEDDKGDKEAGVK